MSPAFLWAGLVCSLAVGKVQAQDTSDLDKCISGQGSTVEKSKCLYAIHGKEDERLNALYRQAMVRAKSVDAGTADELKKSQRAWVTMRDAWCAFEARWEGGTLTTIALPYCLALTTRKRNGELAFYAGEDSPVPLRKK